MLNPETTGVLLVSSLSLIPYPPASPSEGPGKPISKLPFLPLSSATFLTSVSGLRHRSPGAQEPQLLLPHSPPARPGSTERRGIFLQAEEWVTSLVKPSNLTDFNFSNTPGSSCPLCLYTCSPLYLECSVPVLHTRQQLKCHVFGEASGATRSQVRLSPCGFPSHNLQSFCLQIHSQLVFCFVFVFLVMGRQRESFSFTKM